MALTKVEQDKVDSILNYIRGAVAALYPDRDIEIRRTGYKIGDGGVFIVARHQKTAKPLVELLRIAPVVRPFRVDCDGDEYTSYYTADGDIAENSLLLEERKKNLRIGIDPAAEK
jgi:hypothetical protein